MCHRGVALSFGEAGASLARATCASRGRSREKAEDLVVEVSMVS